MLLLLTLSLFSITPVLAHEAAEAKPEAAAQAGMFRHVVMFKFKDDATKEQITAIEKAFGELPSKINTIKNYEWGTNVSKEQRNEGFTHCFIVSFADQAGLDVYTPHAAHQAFVKELLPILDKVMVIDFVSQ